jgi:hypothetical protein
MASRSYRITPGRRSRYPLFRRFRGPESRSERCGEEKNACVGNRTPRPLSRS